MVETDPFDNYLRDKAPDSGVFRLLKQASRFWLRGKSSPHEIDLFIEEKIPLIASWLASEQTRQAGWLDNKDGEGVPRRLSSSFSDIFNAAHKWQRRQPKPPKQKTPDLSGLPPGELRCKRWDCDQNMYVEATDTQWGHFTGQSREEFLQDMTTGLPWGTNIKIILDEKNRIESLVYRNGDEEDPHITFNRNFQHEQKLVDDYGDYVAPHLWKQGVYRQASANLFRLYKKLGIEKLRLSACDVGVYAHARLGYVPNERDWTLLRIAVKTRLSLIEEQMDARGTPLPPGLTGVLRDVLAEDDPKNFWFIVDQEYPCGKVSLGKALTLPASRLSENILPRQAARAESVADFSWSGQLDLRDPDCITRYTAYLSGAKTPEPYRRPAPAQGAAP